MQICKILIADDEKLAREAIKLQLQKIHDVEVVAECTNGKEALEKIKELKPDILFLDIQMPYLSGIEVLDQLDFNYSPAIIIVSAYDKYAIKAFENDAIDYLVKPYTDERFEKAFKKAYKLSKLSTEQKSTSSTIEDLKTLLKDFGTINEIVTISVKEGTKITLVLVDEIIYLEAAGNYVTIFTDTKKYLHKETLQSLEEKLPSLFVRVHKSTIVNTSYIAELHSLYNGDYLIKLKNGKEVRLSRNYKSRIAHLLE
jgi:two-component system, LytTR family, response regulator